MQRYLDGVDIRFYIDLQVGVNLIGALQQVGCFGDVFLLYLLVYRLEVTRVDGKVRADFFIVGELAVSEVSFPVGGFQIPGEGFADEVADVFMAYTRHTGGTVTATADDVAAIGTEDWRLYTDTTMLHAHHFCSITDSRYSGGTVTG